MRAAGALVLPEAVRGGYSFGLAWVRGHPGEVVFVEPCGTTVDRGTVVDEAGLASDHRTSFQWKRNARFGTGRHHGSTSGRGECSLTT